MIASALIPIHGVSGIQGDIRVDYRPEATPPQVAQAEAIVAAFDWSDAADATFAAQQVKAVATAGIDNGVLISGDRTERLVRALMEIILDEFNLHAAKHNALLNAIDAATTLANLKTAVLAIPDYPTRTAAQLVTAIKAKIAASAE